MRKRFYIAFSLLFYSLPYAQANSDISANFFLLVGKFSEHGGVKFLTSVDGASNSFRVVLKSQTVNLKNSQLALIKVPTSEHFALTHVISTFEVLPRVPAKEELKQAILFTVK